MISCCPLMFQTNVINTLPESPVECLRHFVTTDLVSTCRSKICKEHLTFICSSMHPPLHVSKHLICKEVRGK